VTPGNDNPSRAYGKKHHQLMAVGMFHIHVTNLTHPGVAATLVGQTPGSDAATLPAGGRVGPRGGQQAPEVPRPRVGHASHRPAPAPGHATTTSSL
jgi:hypothetical protein